MLFPKKTKFKKLQKGRIKKKLEYKSNKLRFGNYGLQSLENGYITARQIEAVRRTITSSMNRAGKVWIRIFPDYPVTSKPVEVRMGKGKGRVSHWACKIQAGRILYEVAGTNPHIIEAALKKAINKLPLETRIISEPIV